MLASRIGQIGHTVGKGEGCFQIWPWNSYVEFLRMRMNPHPFFSLVNMNGLDTWSLMELVDLNMEYYYIQLPPGPKQLCTIILPWVNYEHQKIPTMFCNGPDIFQEKIFKLFEGFNMVLEYINIVIDIT